jgi:predicted cupin superfamily sugar epimerase
MLNAAKIRELLKMEALRVEGGYFAETYKSSLTLPRGVLPSSYPGDRIAASAIYYLLTPETLSALHRLRGDEIYHFYLGDPVELLELRMDRTGEVSVLGQDIEAGQKLQHAVPAGVWQGSRLVAGGEYALLGTTVSPGFDYADYESCRRDELIAQYPKFKDEITALTN